MADKEKTQAQSQLAAKGSGGTSTVMVLTVIGALSVGAGLATPYVTLKVLGPKDAAPASKEHDAVPAVAHGTGEKEFLSFGEAVVNLNDGRMSRYLRLSLGLQVDKRHAVEISKALDKNKVILKDWLLRYLSDKQMDDIRGAAGQNRLRREILDQFNTVLCPDGYDRVRDILFEEFNVQ